MKKKKNNNKNTEGQMFGHNEQTKPVQPKEHKKFTIKDVIMRLNPVIKWIKKYHKAIVTFIIVLLSAGNIPNLINWFQPIKIVAKPIEISYALKDEQSIVQNGRIEFKKGVSYYAKIYLTSLNKSYRISNVRIFITLEQNDNPIEVTLNRSSPPAPNSNTLNIQYLNLLEKEKDYLCHINFFLEGEQKEHYDEMEFDSIELRLYGNDGKYKKVNLYHHEFIEY